MPHEEALAQCDELYKKLHAALTKFRTCLNKDFHHERTLIHDRITPDPKWKSLLYMAVIIDAMHYDAPQYDKAAKTCKKEHVLADIKRLEKEFFQAVRAYFIALFPEWEDVLKFRHKLMEMEKQYPAISEYLNRFGVLEAELYAGTGMAESTELAGLGLHAPPVAGVPSKVIEEIGRVITNMQFCAPANAIPFLNTTTTTHEGEALGDDEDENTSGEEYDKEEEDEEK